MELDRLNELHQKAENSMDANDYNGTLEITRQILSLGEHPLTSYIASGLLIDIGSVLGKEEIVKEGIGLLEKDFDAIVKDKKLASSAFYNRGNGYYVLGALKRKIEPFSYFSKIEELNNARTFFRKALEYTSDSNITTSKIWVNAGNCLDNVGRVVEALDCYEQAIKYHPDHGMAIGNKGVGLFYHAHVAGDYQGTFIKESYYLISEALKIGVQPEAKTYFQGYLKEIEARSKDKEKLLSSFSGYPGYKIESESEMDKFLIEFCIKNKLYLNICNFCQRCNAAIGDPIAIKSMIVPGRKLDEIDPLKQDQFLRLSSYLNQIKQDYVTARFLLVLSQYKELSLDFVDKNVKIIDTLDYSILNIRTELVKMSYKSLYNILDKIAFFIDDYLALSLQEDRIYFHTVWYDPKTKVVVPKIIQTNNPSLNALFNLHLDFEHNGLYHYLKKTRNALTHRFINVRMTQNPEDDENLRIETLLSRTIELAKLTRSSILYLLQFVYLEERKNQSGNIPTLIAREIPDSLKNI